MSEESTTPDLVELSRRQLEAANRRELDVIEFTLEADEVRDLGKGVVLSVVRQDARPVGSSARINTREGWVTLWVNGMIARVTIYPDIDEARAAAERLAEERG